MLLGVRQGKKTLKVHTVSLSEQNRKGQLFPGQLLVSLKIQDGAVDVRRYCGQRFTAEVFVCFGGRGSVVWTKPVYCGGFAELDYI